MRSNGSMRGRSRRVAAAALALTSIAVPAAASSGIPAPTATKLNVVSGHEAAVRGVLGGPGRRIKLQGLVAGRWRTWNTTVSGANGGYRLAFHPRRIGHYATRIATSDGTRRIPALDVFRHARATWYGPGLYGNRLACGGRLSSSTLGVAHKTLPCGTLVTLRNGGRELRVKVVDRGPYGRADYDLTAATKRRLHYGDVGTILATR